MTTTKIAAVAGASGLVGQELLRLMVNDYQKIIVLGRTAPVLQDSRIVYLKTDFETLPKLTDSIDDVYCCLGTTLKQAGSKQAFYKVDHDYVCNFANWALQHQGKHFLIITAMGSNPNSRFYYNQVKGQVEADLQKMPWSYLSIFRPSLLLGSRQHLQQMNRSGEQLFQNIYLKNEIFWQKVFTLLHLTAYQPIKASLVAKAMLNQALLISSQEVNETNKVQFIENFQMLKTL